MTQQQTVPRQSINHINPARTRKLTDTALRAALKNRPEAERIELVDGTVPGLTLRAGPEGATWSLRYRVAGEGGVSNRGHKKKGKQHRITIGEYPETTIEAARALANTAVDQAKKGLNPARTLEANATAGSLTVRQLKEIFMRDYVHMKELRAVRKYEMAFDVHILPNYGDVLVEMLTRDQVREMVRKAMVKKPRGNGKWDRPRGGKEAARNALGALRKMINWALREDKLKRRDNPCEGMEENLPKKKSRETVLAIEEMRLIWQASFLIGYPFGPVYRLIMLTLFRKGEWSHVRESHISLKNALCVIPADRYKSDHVHVMPLVPAAVTILEDVVKNHRGTRGDYLFSGTDGEKPIAGWTKAQARIEDAIIAISGAPLSKHWTRQDLRRSVATHLAEQLGMAGEKLIKRVLGHAGEKEDVTAVYNRYLYVREMRAALEGWAKRLLDTGENDQIAASTLVASAA